MLDQMKQGDNSNLEKTKALICSNRKILLDFFFKML